MTQRFIINGTVEVKRVGEVGEEAENEVGNVDTCDGKQTWLLMADSQPAPERPTTAAEIAKWRQICADVAVRHPKLDALYFEGDLIAWAHQPYGDPNYYHYDNWVEDIVTTGVPLERVYTVAGNHDAHWIEPYGNAEYLKRFKKLNYVSYNGNFLNIHISDVRRFAEVHTGHMDAATLEWMRDLVRGHQDTHNIILHLHQPVGNTTIASEMTNEIAWRQERSAEIAAFIRDDPKGRVDLILHGHNDQGIPLGGSTSMDVNNQVFSQNTCSVNVGLHIPSYMHPLANPNGHPASYCTAEVVEGDEFLTLKRWNVDTGEEVLAKRLVVPLRHPVRIKGGERWDNRSEKLANQMRGTWTPSLKFSAGNGSFSPSYTLQKGEFVRDGDVVHFSLILSGTTNAYAGASGALFIDLPFTPASGYYTGVSLGQSMGLTTASAARGLQAYITAPTAPTAGIYLREYAYYGGGTAALLGPANLPSSKAFQIIVGGSYILPEMYDSL